ncbi:MAG: type II CRISPR RNA-guided endonuclease Cas9, partial [Candidatus Dojkabacteria bacterium]|nr:type II CRISPR RNA-guided endonuclease Cas9 [Candidatus Dojkabacteria bacterium]
ALKKIKNIKGTMSLSKKAIKLILPYLEEGFDYYHALEKAIPKESREYIHKQIFLPKIKVEEITNTVVIRCLTQARKLVNEIIRKYGSPSFLHIELARDINKTPLERRKIKKLMENNQQENEGIKKKLKEQFNLSEPSGYDILKYKLWEAQEYKCAYSGQTIDPSDLLFNTQVDHILPYSRSLDDSKANQVLVFAFENQQKGNQTPYEYFGNDIERWNKMVQLWKSWLDNGKISLSKYKRLTLVEYDKRDLTEFIERNLNDTRYATRYFKNFIEQNLLFNQNYFQNYKRRVYTFNGIFTSELRKYYGFNKERNESLRHHALDAVILGISQQSMIAKVQKYYQLKEQNVNYELKFPEPWENFREDVKIRVFSDNPKKELIEEGLDKQYGTAIEYVRPIIVSRMINKKISGQIHDATIRSVRTINGKKFFVSRIRLDELKEEYFKPNRELGLQNQFYGLEDSVVELLKKRLEEYDWDAKKAFEMPIFKPSPKKNNPNPIKTVKIITGLANSYVVLHKSTKEKFGASKRSRIVRVDMFKADDGFYAVPIYIDQALRG